MAGNKERAETDEQPFTQEPETVSLCVSRRHRFDSQPDVTSFAPDTDVMRDGIVDRLRELESVNQKLRREKTGLEHQLMHVLERFATNAPSGVGGMSRDDVRDVIYQTIRELSVTLTVPESQTKAPLAKADYSGFRESLVESTGGMSAIEYSSLSDAYEEICLTKDVGKRIITSESSPRSSEQEPDDIKGFGTEDKFATQLMSPVMPNQPRRKSSEELTAFSASSRQKDRINLNKNDKFKEELLKFSTECTRQNDKDVSHLPKTQQLNKSAIISVLNNDSKKSESPDWLRYKLGDSNLSLINTSLRQNLDDTDSTRTSLGSCSMFTSSSDSLSPSQTPSPVPKRQTNNLSTSMPASPIGPTNRVVRTRTTQMSGINIRKCHIRKPTQLAYQQRDTVEHSLAHILQGKSKAVTKEEVIATMRKLYGLPTGTIPEGTHPTTTQSTSKSRLQPIAPPKVTITRREIKHPTRIEDSSESTSINSQYQIKDIHKGPVSTKPTNTLVLGSREFSGAGRHVPPGVAQTPTSALRTIRQNRCFQRPSSPQPGRTALFNMEYSSRFLNTLVQFGQFWSYTADLLFEPRDFSILSRIAQLIDGLDVYTCSQEQAQLLHRVQAPFPTYTPILASAKPSNHSHESSDLTSELSGPAVFTGDPRLQTTTSACTAATQNLTKATKPRSSISLADPATSEISPVTLHTIQTEIEGTGIPPGNAFVSSTRDTDVDESSPVYEATIFRLSNRVKIWRRYHAVLNSSSLLLYTSETTLLKPPKRCISIEQVRTIRKPHNLSVSITTGLVSSGKTEHETSETIRIGSVPVTRKFPQIYPDIGSRTNYGHFELFLLTGKVHRFRGANAKETETWMLHIKRVFRATLANQVYVRHNAQLVMQGWLQRIRRGEVTWVWCRLVAQYLLYSQNPDSRTFVGFKSLEGTKIRTVHNMFPIPDTHQTSGFSHATTSSVADIKILPEMTSSSDSDILVSNDTQIRNRTIALWSEKSDPVYLVCQTEQEFEQWRDNLCRACEQSKPVHDSLSDPVEIQARVCELWRMMVRPVHVNDPHHTRELIKTPLSRTTDVQHIESGIQAFACLLFLSYPQIEYKRASKTPAIVPLSLLIGTAYWLTMKHMIVKHLINLCLDNPELKDELFLQLIKQAMLSESQTKRLARRGFPHRPRRTMKTFSWFCTNQASFDNDVDTSMQKTDQMMDMTCETELFQLNLTQRVQLGDIGRQMSKGACVVFPSPGLVSLSRPEGWWPVIAVWECLCLILPIVLPSTPVLKCLELLITLYCGMNDWTKSNLAASDLHSELARYAAFCKDTLRQTLNRGGRVVVPSALEVASISIRNPYTHSYPFSIPIHLPYCNTYEVVSFNGGSDLEYVIEQLTIKLALPKPDPRCACKYAIYIRLSGTKKPTRFVYLKSYWKMCDVISLYEQAIVDSNPEESHKIPLEEATAELVFRIQTFSWKHLKKLPMVNAKPVIYFLAHQLHGDMLAKNYPLVTTLSEMTDLIAYLCRADHYDYAELQRKKEATLSELVQNYYPSEWISHLSSDGRSIIQLKLLLLDRWSLISKYSNDLEHIGFAQSLTNRDQAFQMSDEEKQVLHNVSAIRACFSYLRLLRRLAPQRFGTTSFAAHIFYLPGHPDNSLVWLMPQETQLNILSNIPSSHVVADDNLPRCQPCIQMIPYSAIQSFGGQRSGAFFVVYRDLPASQRRLRTPQNHNLRYQNDSTLRKQTTEHKNDQAGPSRTPRNRRVPKALHTVPNQEIQIRKLCIQLVDLNAVLELTDTINYFLDLSGLREIPNMTT